MSEALVSLLVTSGHQSEISTHEAGARALLPEIEVLSIETADDEALAVAIRAELKGLLDALEELRKTITGPMNQAKRAIDALFKPATSKYEDLIDSINAKLRERKLKQLAQESAARALAQAAAKAGESIPTPLALGEQVSGVSYTYTWTYRIDNLDEVTREWLSLDHSKVKIYCRDWAKSDVIPEIPGLRFLRDAQVRSSSR